MDVLTQLNNVFQGVNLDQLDVVQDISRDDEVPITKETVGYIVCGILIDDRRRVLMMQEAKSSCFGQWYLPAGRMEKNEHIVDAVKREVEEEAGLEFEPTTLLAVEIRGRRWYRFTLTGRITGGKLKTSAEQDKESVQAKWFSFHDITHSLKLRAHDIVPLIEIALKHHGGPSTHADLLPTLRPHTYLLLRLVMVHCDTKTSGVSVLFGLQGKSHLPVSTIPPYLSAISTCQQLFQHILGRHDIAVLHTGILCVEHHGKPAAAHDGICVSIMVTMTDKIPPSQPSLYEWITVPAGDTQDMIRTKCQPGQLVPLHL